MTETSPETSPEETGPVTTTRHPSDVVVNIAQTIGDQAWARPEPTPYARAHEILDELSRAGYSIIQTHDSNGVSLSPEQLADSMVPQADHDELVDQLADANKRLEALKSAERIRMLVNLVNATGADIRLDGIRVTKAPQD